MSQSGKFKEFFEDFDNNLETLGIRSYGISITTLEEVFLRVGYNPNNLMQGANEKT